MSNITKFSDFGINEAVLRAITEMGFEAPSPIQAECIPAVLEGKDLVGQAQTGTGKTAAFGIPAISGVDTSSKNVQVLIQCPTRELAIQITAELIKIGKFIKGLNVVPVYGGQPMPRQLTALRRGAQIVVGTPGRTIDHLKRGTLVLQNLSMLVFDEADEMLNMGFREDMEEILTYTKGKVQTIMFSATVPKAIREIMKRYMNNPVNVQIDRKAITAPDIKQYVVEVRDSFRTEAVSRLMDVHGFKLGLMFCNTKRQTEFVAADMQARGFATDMINGDLSQGQRDKVMARFRNGDLDLLVATDVAARGIDVSGVDVVFNFEIPQDPEYYVHRIGRTGRAGRTGTSITFSAGHKNRRLKFIERQIGMKLEPLNMPSQSDVQESRIAGQISELQTALEQGGLKPYIEQIEAMAQGEYSTVEIAAALLKLRAGVTEAKSAPAKAKKPVKTTFDSTKYNDDDMVRVHFNVGKNNKVSPGDLVGAIAGETGIPGDVIGAINIQSNYSFVDIPGEHVPKVIDVMNRSQVKGKRVRVKTG